MKLVIVESPTKSKTLKKYLGKDYIVEASMGHIRDLPKSKLGVDVEENFEPEYKQVHGKGGVVKKLKQLSKTAEQVILATDPDREGEAIAWHTKEMLTPKKGKAPQFTRITFHEITKTAVQKALQNPTELHMDLVNSQQARRILDRLVGYTLSPVLWRKVRRGLSAGRVQSVALRMIVERQKDIDAYKAQEYWEISVLTKTEETQDLNIQLYSVGGKTVTVDDDKNKANLDKDQEKTTKRSSNKFYIDSEAIAQPIVHDLQQATYSISKVDRKERSRSAQPPFTTSTLQQAAASAYGWSGKQTMMYAQQLYEAGMITYHRTDSLHLAAEAVSAIRGYVKTQFGDEYLPKSPNRYKTKSKNAQEAHEAIRPAQISTTTASGEKITDKHQRLYDLIRNRAIASQMAPAVYDQTTIQVKAVGDNSYELRASGSILTFMGWKKVYDVSSKKDQDTLLPDVSAGETLTMQEVLSEQKFTSPPPKFNDASLVKELEKRGIGRPSTYASIISVLVDRGYVTREQRRFTPTPVGVTVVDFLTKNFMEIMEYDFTANMEDDLDKVATGDKDWKKLLQTFWKPFEEKTEDIKENAERVQVPVEKTGESCPECKEGEIVIRSGRYGKFFSCGRFPECKYTAQYVEKLDDFVCPECGKDVVIKRTKRGRAFYGCAGYPACDWASWKDPREKTD